MSKFRIGDVVYGLDYVERSDDKNKLTRKMEVIELTLSKSVQQTGAPFYFETVGGRNFPEYSLYKTEKEAADSLSRQISIYKEEIREQKGLIIMEQDYLAKLTNDYRNNYHETKSI